jgi:FAD synthetase
MAIKFERQWWQQEDTCAYDCLMNILNERAPHLLPIVNQSLDIVEEALHRYKTNELCIGFNGGKDSIVLLNIVLLGIFKQVKCGQWDTREIRRKRMTNVDIMNQYFGQILCFHFLQEDEFDEMVQFLRSQIQLYRLQNHVALVEPLRSSTTTSSQCSATGEEDAYNKQKYDFKSLLSYLLSTYPQLKAVFMGTRHNDPHGKYLLPFSSTDASWPQIMRISPLLHWSYDNIWTFIRVLNIPYCVLYDQGYTSIGGINDTLPNPYLKIGKECFKSAHLLQNGNEYERIGRVKK